MLNRVNKDSIVHILTKQVRNVKKKKKMVGSLKVQSHKSKHMKSLQILQKIWTTDIDGTKIMILMFFFKTNYIINSNTFVMSQKLYL